MYRHVALHTICTIRFSFENNGKKVYVEKSPNAERDSFLDFFSPVCQMGVKMIDKSKIIQNFESS